MNEFNRKFDEHEMLVAKEALLVHQIRLDGMSLEARIENVQAWPASDAMLGHDTYGVVYLDYLYNLPTADVWQATQAVAEENQRAAQTPVDWAYPRMKGGAE